MQSEEFDNKIREAADHHHPAYDEKAWDNMEKLLDKHLPQEKDDRRRIIFFLFLFLLLGGGAWLLISKPWKENKQASQVQQSAAPVQSAQPVQQTAPAATNDPTTSDKGSIATNAVGDVENKKEEKANSATATPVPVSTVANSTGKNLNKQQQTTNATVTVSGNKKINRKQTIQGTDNRTENDKSIAVSDVVDNSPVDAVKSNTSDVIAKINSTDKENKQVAGSDNVPVAGNTDEKINKPENKQVVNNVAANSDVINKQAVNKDTVAKAQDPVVKKTKSKAKKSNSFFFTLSAGPDISFAGTGSTGKIKLLAGAGLGYTFKDRLTIRTGFYTGRKIYSALPGDYHPPADFQLYYPYLEKVDANCKVYEIPLSLSYNFGHTSKQNWFASAGLSSYLMKEETYDYTYKYTPSGQTLQKQWTLLDKNKHYFSVLTLSAGYQRNISKTVSLTAEPYFKLPLSGVGYGKVKLNSAGLLFSVGIKPFNASSKKKRMQQ